MYMAIGIAVAATLVGWIFHWDYLDTAILALGIMILESLFWLRDTNNDLDRFIEKYNADMREVDRIIGVLQRKIEELERNR